MPLQLLLCLFAGALIAPSLAPFQIPYLAIVPPAILYLFSFNKPPKQAFWLGWLFGTGFFGAGVSWVFVSISEHSATPLPTAILLTALFVIGLGLLFAVQNFLWLKYFGARLLPLSFIGIWVLLEWIRSWLFTGFPWLYLGNAALETPLRNLIPIGGVWLASAAFLTISICIAELFRTKTLRPLLILPLPIIGSYLLPLNWVEPKDETMEVALMQPNIPQSIKWNADYRKEIFARYSLLSQKHTDIEMMLWPETAIPALFRNAAPHIGSILDTLDSNNVTLISGMPSLVTDSQHPKGYLVHNSLAILTTNSGIYHKQRLVPFGEYIPLEDLLRGAIDFFNLPMSSFSIPKSEQPLLQVNEYTLAPAICYEIAYPELVRESAQRADFILTVSNDTWFGDSIAPAQHLQIAQVWALENGRWVIRGTNNGITAVINHRGDVVNKLPQFEEGVLVEKVQAMSGHTPFQTYGSLPILLFAALMMTGSIGSRKAWGQDSYPSFR